MEARPASNTLHSLLLNFLRSAKSNYVVQCTKKSFAMAHPIACLQYSRVSSRKKIKKAPLHANLHKAERFNVTLRREKKQLNVEDNLLFCHYTWDSRHLEHIGPTMDISMVENCDQ